MKRKIRNDVVCAISSSAALALVLACSVLAQSTPTSSGKSGDEGLPLPGPASATVVHNNDGSTTTTSRWGRGTKTETMDKNGQLISTVYMTPHAGGGQTQIVESGTVNITTESNSQGYTRRLQKTDSSTLTKTVFEYNEKGQLVKVSVFKSAAMGAKEEPQEIYDLENTPSGSPERYNKETGKFERIPKSDVEEILGRLTRTENEIKEVRNQLTPDELEDVRLEAQRQPMGEPEKPKIPGSESPAPPLTKPKPREGLAPPSDPFEGREQAQRAAEKQLDPCLIGTWRSESVEVTLLNEKGGGEGIVITIGEDHSVTIDYTAMSPMRGGNAKNVWKGIASGHMWATKGRAGVTSIEKAEAYLITNGRRNPQGNYKDLGPAKIMRYECDETKLTTESVTHKITYKRQKE